MTTGERRFALTAFCFALAERLALIATYPTLYSMDAYQRWGGRDHLLVQDWLPATQSIVWAVGLLGGDTTAVRVATAVVAAAAMAAGGLCARRMGGPVAGWFFLPVMGFGPSLTWTTVPYQEGTFLLFLFGGMALALQAHARGEPSTARQWLIADLIFGGLALVRYEGWPVTILYMLWRRDRRALFAAWGMVAWLCVKASGTPSHSASPVHYADWEGLWSRTEWSSFSASLQKLASLTVKTGSGWLYGALIPALLVLARRRPAGAIFFVLVLGGQLLITIGWMLGLETAIIRMHLLPGTLAGLLAATALGLTWSQLPGWSRWISIAAGIALVAGFSRQGWQNARVSIRSVKYEQRLVEKIHACTDCRFVVEPRTKIGTRDRHDGCEILQGISTLLHGREFWCERWAPVSDGFHPTHTARWKKGGYVIRVASSGIDHP